MDNFKLLSDNDVKYNQQIIDNMVNVLNLTEPRREIHKPAL